MRFFQLFLIIVLSSLDLYAQNITLPQLVNLRGQPIGEVEEFLVSKGWEFSGAEEESFESYGSVTFTYNKSPFSDIAESYLIYLYSDALNVKKLMLQVNSIDKYNEYLAAIKSGGNKLIDSRVHDGEIVKIYQGATTTFEIKSSVSSNRYGEDSAIWVLSVMNNVDYFNFFME